MLICKFIRSAYAFQKSDVHCTNNIDVDFFWFILFAVLHDTNQAASSRLSWSKFTFPNIGSEKRNTYEFNFCIQRRSKMTENCRQSTTHHPSLLCFHDNFWKRAEIRKLIRKLWWYVKEIKCEIDMTRHEFFNKSDRKYDLELRKTARRLKLKNAFDWKKSNRSSKQLFFKKKVIFKIFILTWFYRSHDCWQFLWKMRNARRGE